jgi:hypothetical protein
VALVMPGFAMRSHAAPENLDTAKCIWLYKRSS